MDFMHYLNKSMMHEADGRVADWLFMSSPFPTIFLVTIYLFVVIQGQKWMKGCPAFDLKEIIITYNIFIMGLSAYILIELIFSSWASPNFSLYCQAADFSDNPYSIRLLRVCWWFYFSKIIELMDTVFFVLRKKKKQISFLHVYHHTTAVLCWWVVVKFAGGGEAYFSATMNSGIHFLMYFYYLLSALGPFMQPYLWWKKYMTSLQLIQLCLILFKIVYIIYQNCCFPEGHCIAAMVYLITQIILFSNFYYQAYHKQTRVISFPGKKFLINDTQKSN